MNVWCGKAPNTWCASSWVSSRGSIKPILSPVPRRNDPKLYRISNYRIGKKIARPVEYFLDRKYIGFAVKLFHRASAKDKRNQLAVSSWQQFGLQTDSRQRAVGTRQQESKYKKAVGKNQTTASSKKSAPPHGFSKFRFAYCILLTAICLLVSLCVFAARPVEY